MLRTFNLIFLISSGLNGENYHFIFGQSFWKIETRCLLFYEKLLISQWINLISISRIFVFYTGWFLFLIFLYCGGKPFLKLIV